MNPANFISNHPYQAIVYALLFTNLVATLFPQIAASVKILTPAETALKVASNEEESNSSS